MKNPCLIIVLLYKIVIVTVAYDLVSSNHDDSINPPNTVTLRKVHHTINGPEYFKVHLKIIPDSYLANKHLPIWVVHADNLNKLHRVPDVMSDIGEFFMYQDSDSCSAAVYFQERRQFDGTIDNRYIINHVPYDIKTRMAKPSKHNIIKSRAYHLYHPETLPVTNTDDKATSSSEPTGIYEFEEQKIEQKKWKFVESRLRYPDTTYIETLIIVNYDLFNKFNNDYATIVSHILITFNSVDMIYSTVNKPNIKINIAGIIIGDSRESFSSIIRFKCYKSTKETNNEELDAGCLIRALTSLLFEFKNIAFDSFDIVIFLTDYDLHSHYLDKYKKIQSYSINGYAHTPIDNVFYKGYKMSPSTVRIAVISNADDMYQNSPVIAHEMAHLFNALHDEGEYRKCNGECDGNLMKSDGTWCNKCLVFSDRTKSAFELFFKSRDGCIFHNKPRSLQLGPQVIWNEHQQCRCYGYDSASPQNDLWNIINRFVTPSRCKQVLKCQRYENYIRIVEFTSYVMDGTPCDVDKVCWNKKCTKTI